MSDTPLQEWVIDPIDITGFKDEGTTVMWMVRDPECEHPSDFRLTYGHSPTCGCLWFSEKLDAENYKAAMESR